MKYNVSIYCLQCAQRLYDYSKSENIGMEEVYQRFNEFTQRGSMWNRNTFSELSLNFVHEKKEFNDTLTIDFETVKEEDKKYIDFFTRFFSINHEYPYDEKMDWTTKNVGTFFIKILKSLNMRPEYCHTPYNGYPQCNCQSINTQDELELQKLFTLSGQDLSLPKITHMYSLKDFNVLLLENDNSYQFLKCLRNISNEISITNENDFLDQVNIQKFMNKSPCLELNRYPECSTYCKWHNDLFTSQGMTEFLTVMRYALPQRKILLDPIDLGERNIAEKLFGTKNTYDLSNLIAPMSQILFCQNRKEGFAGDDIGMKGKMCDEFFPTPTDQGICMTKNMDIKEIVHNNKLFDPIFEADKQNAATNIEGGSLWGETSLVLFSGANENYEMDQHYCLTYQCYVGEGEIQFQLHQSKELAQLFIDR